LLKPKFTRRIEGTEVGVLTIVYIVKDLYIVERNNAPMAKTVEEEKLDAIIFIDTNIFLDFYRISSSDVSMKYLEQIEQHKDIIIISSQVEMEFKKNRQKVILEGLAEFRKVTDIRLSIPPIVQDTKSVDMLKTSKKSLEDQHKKLVDKISNIFIDPAKHDPVYKTFNTIFQNKSDINLNRDNERRVIIRELAQKRFNLGYPPRKKEDNSFGDAINWEWIIECAINTKKHIIIVTRDADYGAKYNKQPYLNDWLRQEFNQRVGARRKIFLTDRLSEAFKLVKIPVTDDMVKEEMELIRTATSKITSDMLNTLRRMFIDKQILETNHSDDFAKILPEDPETRSAEPEDYDSRNEGDESLLI
jgi:hypothetical protein